VALFDDGEDFAGSFLEHFGVKGMSWGHRKDKGNSTVKSHQAKKGDSEDFTRASHIVVKAKRGGTRALSNKELQDLVTRMNLEQNFARVNTPEAKKKSPMSVGASYVGKKIMKAGDQTVDSITKTAIQIKVNEELKKRLQGTNTKPNPQLKLFDYS
jgi:hypothetical protein